MTLAAALNSGSSGLHVRYEKAGLIFDSLPIPWNADAVIVEANVRLPKGSPHQKHEFTLQLSNGSAKILPEVIGHDPKQTVLRVFFRIPVPIQSCRAEVYWREHSLGQAAVPIIGAVEFSQSLKLQMPTLYVGLKEHAIPCQAFVSGQAQVLSASAILQNVVPLAPAADLDLHLTVRQDDRLLHTIPIAWTSAMMSAKQTLVTAFLPKLRRAGEYLVSWETGTRVLHTHRLKAIAKKRFLRSLRITATRFVVQKTSGALEVVRALPQRDGRPCLDGIARVGPYFYVCSGEAGMAGLASFTLTAVPANADAEALTIYQEEVAVTDGPTPLLPATLAALELAHIKHFALQTSEGTLGALPLAAAPSADFTGEGGFARLDDFLWSPAAEEQLTERLGKLLDEE